MNGLARFVDAQAGGVFEAALAEIEAGMKSSHWMWFVFPQIAGLGRSSTARYYAIRDRNEAEAYLLHPLLGPRLGKCTTAMLAWAGRKTAEAILGGVDAVKFRSSMTLFEAVSSDPVLFSRAIGAFAAGERDAATLERL